ncbi:MAG: hypothetical protein VYE77_10885 [Planctomycetota bacterium]|nr:hypothetical protein [Planctomycetota bacterium]
MRSRRKGRSMVDRPWWHLVLMIDCVLVAATMVGSVYLSPLKLGGENNFATWWSGTLYLVAAMHAYQAGTRGGRVDKLVWYPLSTLFLLLMCTEVSSIHERVARYLGSAAIDVTAVACVSVCAPALIRICAVRTTRAAGLLLVGAFVALAASRVQEWVEWVYQWYGQAAHLRTAAEEGTELLASFLMVAGMLRVTGQGMRTPIWRLLPEWSNDSRLHRLVCIGLPFAVALGLYAATESDLINRGNPSSCYPVAVYLLAASVGCQRWLAGQGRRFGVLAMLLLFCSLGSMSLYAWDFLVYYPDPRGNHSLEVWYSYFAVSYLTPALLGLVWGMCVPGFFSASRSILLLAIVAAGVAVWFSAVRELHMVMASVTACAVYFVADQGVRVRHAPPDASLFSAAPAQWVARRRVSRRVE